MGFIFRIKMQNLIQEIKKNGIYIDNRGNIYGSKYKDCVNASCGLWQKPVELSTLLTILNTQNIQTFLNIGTFNGYTFNFIADYLNGIRPTSCITIDPNDFVGSNKKYPYIYLSCTSDTFKNIPFDLVFIDGDHSYEAVKKDWENVGRFAKVIVFHDINDLPCPDVRKFWSELTNGASEDFDILEIKEVTENPQMMGIGILIKK
jgi:hypothetical protein